LNSTKKESATKKSFFKSDIGGFTSCSGSMLCRVATCCGDSAGRQPAIR
jgi:hypothetical protein